MSEPRKDVEERKKDTSNLHDGPSKNHYSFALFQSVKCDGNPHEGNPIPAEERNWRRQLWAMWVLNILTFAGIVVGSVVAVIYWRQLDQMKQATTSANLAAWNAALQTNITREQFRKDQRPYIGQTGKTTEPPTFFENPTSPGTGQITWNWHMTNYGKSPAVNVRFTQEMRLAGQGWKPTHGETRPSTGAPLVQGGDAFDTVISDPISKKQFESLLGVTDGISIRVTIRYSGIDGTEYSTRLCMSRTNYGSITYCKDSYMK